MKKTITTLVLLFTSLLFIQAQYEGMNISLDSAKLVAIKYNKSLAVKGLSVADANETLWQSIAAGLPQAKATYSYQNSMGDDIIIDFGIPGVAPNVIENEPTSNLQFQVSQLIFSGNYWVGLSMSKLAKEMSVLAYKKSELEICKQVSDAYYAVLLAERMQEIFSGNLKNMEQLLTNTETMVKVGVVESISADQLAIQVASTKNAIVKANQQVNLAYNILRLQLGLGAQYPVIINLTDKLESLVDEEEILSLLVEPFDVDQNINMQLVNKSLAVNNKQISLAKANFLPTVAGYYNYTYKIQTGAFDMQSTNLLGLSASMPLFTSFSNTSKVKQAKIKYRMATLDRDNLTDQLILQEKQLRYSLKTANESYNIQKQNIKVSNRVFDNISIKYEQGAASASDVVTAHNNLLTAEGNYISSVMGLLNAQSDLNNLLGKK